MECGTTTCMLRPSTTVKLSLHSAALDGRSRFLAPFLADSPILYPNIIFSQHVDEVTNDVDDAEENERAEDAHEMRPMRYALLSFQL
jgi:hypothetical protein